MTDKDLGKKIKYIRKQRNLTLQNLADKTGLSVAFMSKLERGLTSPTISSLLKVCKALEVDLAELTQSPENLSPVIRKHERPEMMPSHDGKIKYEFGTQGSRKIKGLWITFGPGARDISRGHSEEELGIIVKGILEVTIGEETYILEEGDTVYINANVPHKLTNIGIEECICFFAIN